MRYERQLRQQQQQQQKVSSRWGIQDGMEVTEWEGLGHLFLKTKVLCHDEVIVGGCLYIICVHCETMVTGKTEINLFHLSFHHLAPDSHHH